MNSSTTYDGQIDRIFEALLAAEPLLTTGRALGGLVIGLSPALAAAIAQRHGERAEMVLNNTWRVDPKRRRDAEA
jgi:hypothetical protein